MAINAYGVETAPRRTLIMSKTILRDTEQMPYIVTEIVDDGGVLPPSVRGRFSFCIHKNGGDFAPYTMTYTKREDAVLAREAALRMIENAVAV